MLVLRLSASGLLGRGRVVSSALTMCPQLLELRNSSPSSSIQCPFSLLANQIKLRGIKKLTEGLIVVL
jgi:hypothetical protein